MLNEELVTIFSDHSIALQRVATAQGNKVDRYIEIIETKVKARIEREVGKNLTPLRRQKLIDDIHEITRANLQTYVAELKVDNRAIGANEAVFAAETVDSVMASDLPYVVPTAAAVNQSIVGVAVKVGKDNYISYNKLMRNFWENYTDQMDNVVRTGFIGGKTTQEIANSLMNDVGGVLNRTKNSAMSTAITGLNHAANMGRATYYQDNDFVIGYRLLAVIDSRTSQTCRGIDNTLIKKTDPRYNKMHPPFHVRCRTAETPEVDARYKLDDDGDERITNFVKGADYKEDKDGEKTGKVIGGKREPKGVDSRDTYYQAFAKMDDPDQDRVLGKKMGEAFRKLNNPDEFAKLTIDSLGNPYTIEQMKARDNALGEILKAQRKK